MQAKIMTCRNLRCFGTQNPIEQEGTYPLPEAQLDRSIIDRGWLPRYRHGTYDYFRDHGCRNGRASAVFDADGLIAAQS